MVAAGTANAAGEAELAQKSGCMTCHSVDTKKMGPAFKDVAKKYKGQASAEADLVAALGEADHDLAAQLAGKMGVRGELDGDLDLRDLLIRLDLQVAQLRTGGHAISLGVGRRREAERRERDKGGGDTHSSVP